VPVRKRLSGQGTETVLLVEDEVAVRQLARDILQAGGYRVLEAADGLEALKLAETTSQRIHLLVTDLVMPHMGGRELADEIRKRWSGIRILFMSGYTDDVIHADVARAANFLPKPFTPEALAQKVRETLDTGGAHASRPR
jgi:CheY-like chemotaxis protein